MSLLKSSPISSQQIARALVKNRRYLMGGLLLFSLLLLVPASRIRIDNSGVAFNAADTTGYNDYQHFVDAFGNDDYILLAVKNTLFVTDPQLKKRINGINDALTAMPSVLKVIDLGTMESSSLFKLMGLSHFWDKNTFDQLRPVVPGFRRLISHDMKTIAFIVKIDNEALNGFQLEKQLKQMKQIIGTAFPEHPHCYAAGIPVMRAAFERYNLFSALVFGGLGLLFGTLVAVYIFKTLWAAIMVLVASGGALLWTIGIMGSFGIALNLATGLSFGFILVVSTTTVFHILSKYVHLLQNHSPDIALAKGLEIVIRPCFMCALTTSAGFLSLSISPVKMVSQAGLIISLGVMVSFLVTLLISTFCLPQFLGPRYFQSRKTNGDVLDHLVGNYAIAGFQAPRTSLWAGIVFFIILAAGIPSIQTVKHLTSPILNRTQEAMDFSYIDEHLSTAYSFSIVLSPFDNTFDSRKFWYELSQFEKRIEGLPGVRGIESLTPLIFRLALNLSPAGVIPEFVYHQMVSNSSQNDLVRSYLEPVSKRLRLVVNIQNNASDEIETLLKRVQADARQTFAQKAGVVLSGQLLLLRSHTTDLVSSQLKTLFLALLVITLLMMFQLNSFVLGLLSLIPNLFPLITIFGIMGWFHIPLDPLTIFAAVISFGLSVDDSIHFLTQLKRELMALDKEGDIRTCLMNAHAITARSLVATTAVLFLSCLGLLFSSFSHVFSLGVLISSASLIALIGDLIFMPAAILTIKPLNQLLSFQIKPLVDLNGQK
jgi:predicted RND superfamily exporter protein